MREGGVPVTEKHPIGGGGRAQIYRGLYHKMTNPQKEEALKELGDNPTSVSSCHTASVYAVCMRGVCSQSLGHSRRWLLCPFKPWGTNIDDLRILIICLSPVHAVLCCQDKGSSQHWFQQHQKLQALVTIKNHQHSFWQSVQAIIALSCILMMHSTTSLTILICEQAVIKHSHI